MARMYSIIRKTQMEVVDMQPIILDDEQALLIVKGGQRIPVHDAQHGLVGWLYPAPPDVEVAEMKRRVTEGPNGPCRTTEEVLNHLRSME